MKVTLTAITLKDPFHFFLLSSQALRILAQLRSTDCKAFKKKGVWTKHYTMTLWDSEEQLRAFAQSGAHKEAMQKSKRIAREIRTFTYDAEVLPTWAEAMRLLEKAKVLRF